MSGISAAQQIDANSRTVTSNEAFLLESTWTFVENLTGDQAAHTVFTVTGNVLISCFAVCDTSVVGAGTMELGVTGNTAGLIAQIANATTLDDGDVWVDADTAVGVGSIPVAKVLNDGNDVILTIGAADLTAGVVDIYCTWRPLSSGASVTVTTPA